MSGWRSSNRPQVNATPNRPPPGTPPRQGRPAAALSDEQLGRIYRGQLEKAERFLASSPAFQLLKVAHRELLSDPAPVAERINHFLGGDLDLAAMAAVVDPALYRERACASREKGRRP